MDRVVRSEALVQGQFRTVTNRSDDGNAGNSELLAQPGDGDGGFAVKTAGIQTTFAGNAEVCTGQSLTKFRGVDHDVRAACEHRSEEGEQAESQAAGRASAGRLRLGEFPRSLG